MDISDRIAFDSLVRNYRESLTRAAYHLCGDREAACDIVQETFVAAYKAFAGLREPDKASAWLYTILRHKVISNARARKPEVELVEDCATASTDDAQAQVRQIVIEQMSKLSEEDREILAGKYLLGLSYKELAESLGVKESVIRVRSLRAKERLRQILRGVGVTVPEKR